MCEYDPECTKHDDPLAMLLWKSRKRAKAGVYCPLKYCPLAAVFDLPGRPDLLCQPYYESRAGSVFIEPDDPDAIVHFHALLRPLSEIAGIQFGRCGCGTWNYTAEQMLEVLKLDWPSANAGPKGPKTDRPWLLGSYVRMADSPEG